MLADIVFFFVVQVIHKITKTHGPEGGRKRKVTAEQMRDDLQTVKGGQTI